MLCLFKNKKEKQPYLGLFTQYDVEDLYYELPLALRENLYTKNPMLSGLGKTRYRDFFLDCKEESTVNGPLDLFYFLLDFVIKDDDFAIKLYERSKSYNEDNYYKSKNLNKLFKKNLELQERYIKYHSKSNESIILGFSPRFWVELHNFYSKLIKILHTGPNDNIIYEMIESYCKFFKKITDQVGFVYGWDGPLPNIFIYYSVIFLLNKRDFKRIKFLIDLKDSIPNTWYSAFPDELEEKLKIYYEYEGKL